MNEDNEKHDSTSSNHSSTKPYTTHMENDTELNDPERIPTQLKTQIVSEENVISQPFNYEKVSENNVITNEKADHLAFLDTPSLITYKSNESNHMIMSNQNIKFKCEENQFLHTSLPIDKLTENSKQREEKLVNTKGNLYHSDIFESYEHVILTMNSPTSLDNNYSAYIKCPDNMDEKKGIIHETFYPYHQYEQQQLTEDNQTHTYLNNKQQQQQYYYYPLIQFKKEGSHLELTNNHKEMKKSNSIFLTSFLNSNSNKIDSIDQSLNLNHLQYSFNKLNIELNHEKNKTNIKQNDNENLSIINNQSLKSIENSNNLVTFSDTTQNLFTIPHNNNNTITPVCFGIETKQQQQPTYTTQSLSLTKPLYYIHENLLKRAKFILSNSLLINEPDPTDTLLALTEDNNSNNNNQSHRSSNINLNQSSIKNYFLSLSCPQSINDQSINNQLINDNYDTLSESSNFSIHIPITNSIEDETNFNFKKIYTNNKHLWKSLHSQWYIHILKRIIEEAEFTTITEQTIDYDNFPTKYMSSSSSSRGSYFGNQGGRRRRRPHSSAYSYEVNSLIDDLPGLYESPNSSSSIIQSGYSYNHRSLHDVYPDRYIKSFNDNDDDDNYRINFKPSSKSNLKYSYDSRPYRSYSEASTSHHHYHHPQKDRSGLASIIRHDRRNKLGLIHHSSNRSKHTKLNDVETVLQQRILKDPNRNLKSIEFEKSKDFMYPSRLNKNYQDYETSHRIKRGNLRSYTPTYKSFYTPQTKWSNDSNYLEVGSYFSLPLNDYHRKGIKHSRPTLLTNQRYDLSSIELPIHQKVSSDEWNKSDHYLTRRIGNLSKSTGHLSHLDDLNKFSNCTSMQTLRARLAAAHSEFNLDQHENISDSFESRKFNNNNKFGSLDYQTDSNDFTTRQLRQQVEQHHRRLLKSLMSDEPYESSWPSSFSNFDLQGYLNSYCDESEMRPTTLISSTLAPPIFSTASTRLPLSIEQGKIDETIVEPINYLSTTDQQFLPISNMLTTSNLNSTTPVALPNQVPLSNNLADNIMNNTIINQPTSVSLNEQIPISNNTLVDLINNPDFIQALTYNPELINQINSMCLDLAPADLNQVTLAAVAGAIAATAVAGSGMLDSNTTTDNTNNVITCQPTNEQIINDLLLNAITSDQMTNYLNTGNFISNNNTTDLINNVSSINSTYLNTMNLPNSQIISDITNNNSNIPRMNTSLPDGNSSVDNINPESIDILIEQVRKLLNEQNKCDLINPITSINNININDNNNNTTITTTISSSSSMPLNNPLISSLPSSIHQTSQSIMTEDKIQNPVDIYCNNYQKSLKPIHNQSINEVNKQQYNQISNETMDNWHGLSEDEWNYKTYKGK
ncbi:putative ccaat-box DNA binding protein subunit B [Schistosoma mansoni]|uniref:putative ccaat-box DNA binding protein subunit B n=1 Tax=Schistosoma mansoni TaxID=6183 RepID=UPI00022DC6F9|nr:putative ccaat-box DNA binding protein subunit B [Schistosoma mansoni]|eukprot:XP_018652217.1 putative ccaat-box DNA binding protein subunit B [Schistosoma mansoni]